MKVRRNFLNRTFQDPYSVAGQIALTKKQGVSGQSVAVSHDVHIDVHEKDFRSKTLIKEAIMENDFLKNLSINQVNNKYFPRILKNNPRCGILLTQCMKKECLRVAM